MKFQKTTVTVYLLKVLTLCLKELLVHIMPFGNLHHYYNLEYFMGLSLALERVITFVEKLQMFWVFYRQSSELEVSGGCNHLSTLLWNQNMKKIKWKILNKSEIKCTLLPKYSFFAGIRAYANSTLHTKQTTLTLQCVTRFIFRYII